MPSKAQLLEALSRAEILETPLAEVFDRIVHIATGIFAVPIVTVSLFEEARARMESHYGLDTTARVEFPLTRGARPPTSRT